MKRNSSPDLAASAPQSTLEGRLRRFFQPQNLAWWDSVLLGFLLLAMCSQFNLGDIGQDTTKQGYVTKQLKIALPDIALLLNFVWFLLRTTMLRAWKRLWWPPLPCWALIFAMIVATIHSPSIWDKIALVLEDVEDGTKTLAKTILTNKSSAQAIKEAIAETIQFGLYFLVAPWLFVNLLHDRRGGNSPSDAGQSTLEPVIDRRSFALSTLTLAFALSTLIALRQSVGLMHGAPQALFGSPNAWAAFVAITLPLLIAFVQIDDAMNKVRRFALAFFALSLLTVFSPWATIAAIIGSAFAALLLKGALKVRVGLVALLLLVFSGVLWIQQGPTDVRRAETLHVGSAQQKVKKQFIEWYAATAWALPGKRAFANGVGPGNYQLNIGPYYGSGLPNEEKMPPDSNNLYLVQGVAQGALGLGALLWTISHFAALAWRARQSFAGDWLPAGLLGSFLSWAMVNIFHASIVRGTGVVLAFLFALAVLAARDDQHINREDEAR